MLELQARVLGNNDVGVHERINLIASAASLPHVSPPVIDEARLVMRCHIATNIRFKSVISAALGGVRCVHAPLNEFVRVH